MPTELAPVAAVRSELRSTPLPLDTEDDESNELSDDVELTGETYRIWRLAVTEKRLRSRDRV